MVQWYNLIHFMHFLSPGKSIVAKYQSFTKQFKRFQTYLFTLKQQKPPFFSVKTAQKNAFLPHFSSKNSKN